MHKKAFTAVVIISLFLLSLVFSFQLKFADSQNSMATPEVEWTQILPGISGTAVVQTTDGGYLALGKKATVQNTDSGPIFANQTSIIVKTDSAGKILWTKTLQVNGTYPEAGGLIATSGGGYAIIAEGSVGTIPAAYLIKTDAEANILWSQLFPSYPSPVYGSYVSPGGVNSLVQTSQGGYALVGTYYVGGGPWIPFMYFVRTDASGNLLFNKTVAGGAAITLVPTSDGGYGLIHFAPSMGGGSKYGVLKIDADGNVQWTKLFLQEGSVSSYSDCGLGTPDGGYLIGGYAIRNEVGLGWLVKTDGQGNAQWNVTFQSNTTINSIVKDRDGGYVLVGRFTNLFGLYYQSTQLSTWIAEVDEQGNLQGQTFVPMGNYDTHPKSIIQTFDGGFAFVGTYNESYAPSTGQSFWLVKVAPIKASTPTPKPTETLFPSPTQQPTLEPSSTPNIPPGNRATVAVIAGAVIAIVIVAGLLRYLAKRKR